MPRSKERLHTWKRSAEELWTDTFHYRVTFSDGRVVMVDDNALIIGKMGLVYETFNGNGGGSGYSHIPENARLVIEQWNYASQEERMEMVLSGTKVERGKFVKTYEVEVDYE